MTHTDPAQIVKDNNAIVVLVAGTIMTAIESVSNGIAKHRLDLSIYIPIPLEDNSTLFGDSLVTEFLNVILQDITSQYYAVDMETLKSVLTVDYEPSFSLRDKGPVAVLRFVVDQRDVQTKLFTASAQRKMQLLLLNHARGADSLVVCVGKELTHTLTLRSFPDIHSNAMAHLSELFGSVMYKTLKDMEIETEFMGISVKLIPRYTANTDESYYEVTISIKTLPDSSET